MYGPLFGVRITHDSLEVDGGVDCDVLLGDGGEQVAAAAEPADARVAQGELAERLDVVDQQVHQPVAEGSNIVEIS